MRVSNTEPWPRAKSTLLRLETRWLQRAATMDFTAYKAAYKGLPCISKSTSDSWWEKLSCANAFKQFIPNPLNSSFLSEADDTLEGGAENRERAGWLGSWGNAANLSPLLGAPAQQGGERLAANSLHLDNERNENNERLFVGFLRSLVSCLSQLLPSSSISSFYKCYWTNTECHQGACHHTTQRQLHLTAQGTRANCISCPALLLWSLQGPTHLLHTIHACLGRHSFVYGEEFCQIPGTETKRSQRLEENTEGSKACVWSLELTVNTECAQHRPYPWKKRNTEVGNGSLSVLSRSSTFQKNFMSAFVYGKWSNKHVRWNYPWTLRCLNGRTPQRTTGLSQGYRPYVEIWLTSVVLVVGFSTTLNQRFQGKRLL